jgi:Tol biopolymer transport system component
MRAAPCAAALLAVGCATPDRQREFTTGFTTVGEAQLFAPGVASTPWSDLRLTISPDGRTALWFSRNRPGGAGGYDIWMSRREQGRWGEARPVIFNSAARDFDPAFTADGRYVYFCSDRPGGAGGDDLYRVPVIRQGFGEPQWLSEVNTPGNEWAPMLSPDGRTLLFTSNGHAGAQRLDLFVSRLAAGTFSAPKALAGINTMADEFDATFLADGHRVVFSRARDIAVDPVRLFVSHPRGANYSPGTELSTVINTPGSDTYAPMLDWSRRGSLTFTTRRPADSRNAVDVYTVRYR